jgi:hypothetical protein
MKSWLSTKCSIRLDVSGADGVQIKPHCEDKEDKDSYMRYLPEPWEEPPAARDWRVQTYVLWTKIIRIGITDITNIFG